MDLIKGVTGGNPDFEASVRGQTLKYEGRLADLRLFFYERVRLTPKHASLPPADEEIWVTAEGCKRPAYVKWGESYETAFCRAFPSFRWLNTRFRHGGQSTNPESRITQNRVSMHGRHIEATRTRDLLPGGGKKASRKFVKKGAKATAPAKEPTAEQVQQTSANWETVAGKTGVELGCPEELFIGKAALKADPGEGHPLECHYTRGRADTLSAQSTGVVFVRRDRLKEVAAIRSKGALAVVFPGWPTPEMKAEMIAAGLQESATCEATLIVQDTLRDWKALRTVTILNLGAKTIRIAGSQQSSATFGAAPYCEMAIDLVPEADMKEAHIQLLEDGKKTGATQVIEEVFDISFTGRVYAFRTLEKPPRWQVLAMLPRETAERLLHQSGTHGLFIRQVARPNSKVSPLDADMVTVWSTTTLKETKAAGLKLPGAAGLVVNATGYGLRVVPGENGINLKAARSTLRPKDPTLTDANSHVIAKIWYEVQGVPPAITAADLVALMGKTHGSWEPWLVIPKGPTMVRDGRATWSAGAEKDPTQFRLETKEGALLVQKLTELTPPTQKRTPQKPTPAAANQQKQPPDPWLQADPWGGSSSSTGPARPASAQPQQQQQQQQQQHQQQHSPQQRSPAAATQAPGRAGRMEDLEARLTLHEQRLGTVEKTVSGMDGKLDNLTSNMDQLLKVVGQDLPRKQGRSGAR